MGKFSDYKKKVKDNPCYYCDYLNCRKGHKCSYYKKYAKSKNAKGRC